MSTIEQLLERDGMLVYRTRGTSMEPMLRQNRDIITVRVPSGRLKKYDVALYRRGPDHVLHRVVGVEDGGYRIRGDNTYSTEYVLEEDILGVLTEFRRKGQTIRVSDPGYRCYTRIWCALYPVRYFRFCCRRAAARAARRTGLSAIVKRVIGRE